MGMSSIPRLFCSPGSAVDKLSELELQNVT